MPVQVKAISMEAITNPSSICISVQKYLESYCLIKIKASNLLTNMAAVTITLLPITDHPESTKSQLIKLTLVTFALTTMQNTTPTSNAILISWRKWNISYPFGLYPYTAISFNTIIVIRSGPSSRVAKANPNTKQGNIFNLRVRSWWNRISPKQKCSNRKGRATLPQKTEETRQPYDWLKRHRESVRIMQYSTSAIVRQLTIPASTRYVFLNWSGFASRQEFWSLKIFLRELTALFCLMNFLVETVLKYLTRQQYSVSERRIVMRAFSPAN